MPEGRFFREADPELSQGDILDGIPSTQLKSPILAFREVTLKGGRKAYGAFPYPPVVGQTPDSSGKSAKGGVLDFTSGESVSTFCQIGRAIVLNYDCDIENDKKHALVSLVRPLGVGQEAAHCQVIRENRNYSYCYLPADQELGLPEAFVDFRRVTCLHPEILAAGTRIASLSQEALRVFQRQLMLYFTRREPNWSAIRGRE